MRIAYTPEQERLRAELRAYFAGLMTPEMRAALSGGDEGLGDGDAYRQVVRQLGKDGWLALGWPAEHGGRGGTMLDQLIFTDEAAIARVPVPFLTINTVGPTIMRYGTPEQKAFYLPRIAAGELHFSIGYSEPEAGTDLAALRTTAVRDGEERVIDAEWVQLSLARVHAKAEFLKLLNWRVASGGAGSLGPADASATKVFGTEFAVEAYRLLMEVLGPAAVVRSGSPGEMLAGR